MPRNVASLASAPSQPQREQQQPTIEEVLALIDAAEATESLFGLYVRVVAATGMRRSEACGLRWSDIDLDAGRLVVQRSHLSLPGSVGDQPTKTRSVRTATLDPDTVTALRSAWRAARHLARFAGVDDDQRRAGYVFSFDADGASAWRGDTVTARWSRTRRAAGVDGVRLVRQLRRPSAVRTPTCRSALSRRPRAMAVCGRSVREIAADKGSAGKDEDRSLTCSQAPPTSRPRRRPQPLGLTAEC